MLGTGQWSVFVTGRGGSPVLFQLAFDTLSGNRPIDATGQARIAVPVTSGSKTSACEALNEIEPWRDEIVIYRNDDIAFVGPVISIESSRTSGASIFCHDLFHWMEKRWIEEDLFYSYDVARIFADVFERAMAVDTSPNIDIVWHEVGVEEVLEIIGKETPRAADLLRGLSRTAVDFTTIGRTVYVGGEEVYSPTESPLTPIVLHDGGVGDVSITKDGTELVTDVSVFGEGVSVGTQNRIYGRATLATNVYGVLQASFAELDIKNTPAANANASSRVRQMFPLPRRARVPLTPSADCEFKELLPGRRMDCRLEEAGCIPLVEVMRMGQESFEVGSDGEKISLDLIPLGGQEEN